LAQNEELCLDIEWPKVILYISFKESIAIQICCHFKGEDNMIFRLIAIFTHLALFVLAIGLLAGRSQAQITSGAVYTLTCRASGLALDNEGSTAPRNGVWQWGLTAGATNQQWQINKLPNGYYNMVCLTSGMALDSAHAFANGGAAIQNQPLPGNNDQQWIITSAGSGYYTLVNAATGLALDNRSGMANGAPVGFWKPLSGSINQQWQLTFVKQLPIASGSIYTLKCKTGSLNLDNAGSTSTGSNVYQWGAQSGIPNQQWQINVLPDSGYSLVCLTSGMALDNRGSTVDGGVVGQWTPQAGNSNQDWTIASAGSGYYTLVCKTSNKALDNSGATANGGSVYQWTVQSGNANQQWAISSVQIGANTPFTSYEAEGGTLGGAASVTALTGPPTTMFASPQLEASGHAYVNLSATGDSVTWTNNTGQNISAINVRYSIPDSSGGGGITSTLNLYVNGTFRQAVNVNSLQTWMYETSSWYDGMSQTPSFGNPHVFWDEAHVFITGAAVAPGSTITLKKDSANTAAFYNIDVVDLEMPPVALTQPANSLSIVSYGAVANNASADSTTALQNCINAAQSQGKSVWIPQGTFYINTVVPIYATGVTISGAGMWYSTLYSKPALPTTATIFAMLDTVSCTLRDFAVDGNAIDNSPADGKTAGINIKGSNWLIDRIWIQHHGAGIWADGSNGTVQNCRLNSLWADGINLNNGNGAAGNNTGNYLTAYNNFVRGAGDDGFAINCGSASGTSVMTNNTVLSNTSVAPWWADNIGVYGGVNNLIANNLATDCVKQNGIVLGLYANQDYLQSALCSGNMVYRCGSLGYGNQNVALTVGNPGSSSVITNVNIFGNKITDSLFGAAGINSGTGILFSGNYFSTPGQNAIEVVSGAQGNAVFTSNTVANLPAGKSAFINNSPSTFTVSGSGNIGFLP